MLSRCREINESSLVLGMESIPEIFCWTKMGSEAGQSLDKILHRKELERLAGDNTFAWGIGNSLGNAVEMVKQLSSLEDVDVLFTPMKSAPKLSDVFPSQIFLWLNYQTRAGQTFSLPEHMLVTSRGGVSKRTHYALLCKSETKLVHDKIHGSFDSSDVRNFASLNPVGASQVTSVVRYSGSNSGEKAYSVALKATLYGEGFVKLVEPVVLNKDLLSLYEDLCGSKTKEEWLVGIKKLKVAAIKAQTSFSMQSSLSFA